MTDPTPTPASASAFNSEPEILQAVLEELIKRIKSMELWGPNPEPVREELIGIIPDLEELSTKSSLPELRDAVWAISWRLSLLRSGLALRRYLDSATRAALRIAPRTAPIIVVNHMRQPKRGFDTYEEGAAWARANEPYKGFYLVLRESEPSIKWQEPSPLYSNG